MIANHKGEIPVVIVLLPFLAGICCALYFVVSNLPVINWALGLAILLFAALNLFYSKFDMFKRQWLGGLLLAVVLFLSGYSITISSYQLNQPDHFSKHQAKYLGVVVSSEPVVKNNLTRFTANVTQTINGKDIQPASGSVLITIKDKLAQNMFYGEKLVVPANYTTIEPPFNPGEFNYKQYLAHKNIYHQAFLYPKQYSVLSSGKANPVIAYALMMRQKLVNKLKTNIPDTTAAAVASTLILGYKADLSNDILQAYSKTGTIHILSVSGGHVAIIYLLLSWALAFLHASKRGRIIKAVVIITLIWLYALLTGLSPAVCRAALMISFIISGKAYARYINSLNLLAASAFVLLLYDPLLFTDVGFQLSYLAVAGLIVFQPVIYDWLNFENKWLDKLWLACSVSIAAQVITFPLSAYYFHQIPVYFLLSNLLIIIPVTVIMYAGLLLLVLPQIPGVSALLGYILEKSILLMNKVLAFVEHMPFASVNKIWLSKFEHLVLYVIIAALFYYIYNKQTRWLKLAGFSVLAFSISISYKRIKADNEQSITFLNLRKHSGIVFKNGGEGVVLTDLKESDKNFQYAVQPALDSNRIVSYQVIDFANDTRLKYLITQHHLIQFLNKRILILNDEAQLKSIPKRLNINYLFITNNALIDAATLNYPGKTLIIDANNADKYIADLIAVLNANQLNFKLLKRNKAAVILSN